MHTASHFVFVVDGIRTRSKSKTGDILITFPLSEARTLYHERALKELACTRPES